MRRRSLALLLLPLLTTTATACLWDKDTLAMERERFPTALEVITGKVLHHSSAFYAWRVEDRRARLEKTPDDLRLMDDLAVGLDKCGRTQEGLEVLRRAHQLAPKRYETLANLGTLLIHDGQLEAGLAFIRKAIAINPAAHFGREVYQQKLVEYVLARRAEGATLPLSPLDEANRHDRRDFVAFLAGPEGRAYQVDPGPASKGVLGMLVFGNNDSPILLEVLGDLLIRSGHKRLAARAYLRASYEAQEPQVRAAYRALAKQALSMQTKNRFTHATLTLAELEPDFQAELAEAKAWRSELAAAEAGWIASGEDPEAAYAARYHTAPRIEGSWLGALGETATSPAGLAILAVLALWWARRRRLRRQA